MSNIAEKSSEKLSPKAHIMCGWPFLLVLIGGAIGGLLGAAAYSLNVAIYKSDMSRKAKIFQNALTGFGAFVAWFVSASVISGFFWTS